MALIQRRGAIKSGSVNRFCNVFVLIGNALRSIASSPIKIVLCSLVFFIFQMEKVSTFFETSDGKNAMHSTLADGVTLTIDLDRIKSGEQTSHVTLGPHKASLDVNQQDCKNPRVWIRLTGDALVPVPLSPDGPKKWSGLFTLPLHGFFQVDARWYGCDTSKEGDSFSGLTSPIEFTATGIPNVTLPSKDAWISSSKFTNAQSDNAIPPFVWMSADSQIEPSASIFLPTKSSMGESLVAKEATPISSKGIRKLSNYEIVCWIGSESATSIYENFLSLRLHIAPNQRPFKFHNHYTTDFTKPDQYWDRYDEEKKKFRKCKIVFISLDTTENSISQADYKIQVKNFVSHIVKALKDETFPIWVATVNEAPIKATTLCHSPTSFSFHHPCNDALREIFLESSFPSHVRLMDNTDLSSPYFGEDTKDILAVITMRLYALIANQVDEWRKGGQVGTKDGLQRGGTLESNPTPETPMYEWK